MIIIYSDFLDNLIFKICNRIINIYLNFTNMLYILFNEL